jgi:hypothetical protein
MAWTGPATSHLQPHEHWRQFCTLEFKNAIPEITRQIKKNIEHIHDFSVLTCTPSLVLQHLNKTHTHTHTAFMHINYVVWKSVAKDASLNYDYSNPN